MLEFLQGHAQTWALQAHITSTSSPAANTERSYIGVTNNLAIRLEQHRGGRGSEFVKKYAVHRLVHVETYASPIEAITREKQLKNWHRDWKARLIEENNPDWSDLSALL